MTTSVTDEMIDHALYEFHVQQKGLGRGTARERVRRCLEAALRSQGNVVSFDALQGLCDEWENMKVPHSASSYELGMFDGYRGAHSDLTAIIGEGD